MNDYRIRHIEPSDAAAVQQIMSDASTYGNTLQLPYQSVEHWRRLLDSRRQRGGAQLVCEAQGRVVGNAGLWCFPEPGRSHAAGLGISVHRDWQGQGVGRALMTALMDLADNWLGIARVELNVFADNQRAQALYRRFGFVEEIRMRAHSLRDGQYCDVLAMARVKG